MRTCGLEEHRAAAGVAESGRRQDPQLTEPITRWAVASDVTSALLDLDDGHPSLANSSRAIVCWPLLAHLAQ